MKNITTSFNSFGMLKPNRNTQASTYRYGFNGKENDNEVKGVTGSQVDFGARVYDARIGRFLSIDALAGKTPGITPYRFGFNSPISYFDPDGNYEADGTLTKAQKRAVKSMSKQEAKQTKGNYKEILAKNEAKLVQENIKRIDDLVADAKNIIDTDPLAKEVFGKLTGSTGDQSKYDAFFTKTGNGPKIQISDLEVTAETEKGTSNINFGLFAGGTNFFRGVSLLHEYIHYASYQKWIVGDGTTDGFANLEVGKTIIDAPTQRDAIVKTINAYISANPSYKNNPEELLNKFGDAEYYNYFNVEISDDKKSIKNITGVRVEGGFLFEILTYGKPITK